MAGRVTPSKPVARTLCLLLCCLLLGGSNALAQETVHLAIGEWPPYTSESDAKSKLLETVVIEAFKLENVNVKFTYLPWKRSYLKAEDGTFDGTFPWNKTPERDQLFVANRIPLVTDSSVYFHLKRTVFDWKTMEDLKHYRVGVTLGYKNETIYRRRGIVADVAPSEELNFRKILAGRIDVYETSRVVGYATIHKTLAPDQAKLFTHHPRPSEENDYFILFSRATPHAQTLADRFDSGMKKLKANGTYAQIFAR